MHHDQVEGMVPITGALDHLLEDWSAIIRSRSAGLDELGHHCMTFGPAP
jgi:hypothetical protein